MSDHKNIKILLLLSIVVIWGLAASPSQAQIGPAGQDALDFLGETAKRGGLTDNPKAATDPTEVVSVIINTILSLVGIIFFAHMFYAGFRWMTSGGSEEIIKTSKETIRQSIIGITIIFGAFIITNFVLNRLERLNQSEPTPAAPAAAPQPQPSPGGGVPPL